MVVATVGRPERLAVLVDAVLADPAASELVVVVDGPDRLSLAVLESLAVTRVRLHAFTVPRQGQLGALMAGVREATGDVVVLLDDDVLPARGTIGGHLAAHRHRAAEGDPVVVVGPMPVMAVRSGRPSVATTLYAAEYAAHLRALERGEHDVLDVLWTGNLSMRRVDCLRVGLASPTFTAHYHADQDLGFRLRRAGLSGRYEPALLAAHLHERTDAQFLADARRQGEGRAALHRAHPDRLGPFTPTRLVADLRWPVKGAVRAIGGTELAEPTAKRLMRIGGTAAQVGWPGAQLALAKLARRLMQWRGATVPGP